MQPFLSRTFSTLAHRKTLTLLGLRRGELHSQTKLDPSAPSISQSRVPSLSFIDPQRYLNFANYMKSTLLPNGYPLTTRPGYLPFLVHVTSASCSNCTMNFMLTQALFMSLGGQSPGVAMGASAALTWVLKDGIGLFAGVASARKIGEWLSVDIKKWRLISFWLLGAAYVLDLTTLQFPGLFLVLAGVSNGIKSMAYIAVSGSNAYINQYFAKANNLADIAGKCSAQNTLGAAMGYVFGIGLSTFVSLTSIKMLFPIIVVGTAVNLLTTRYAMKWVDIPYFNDQRLKLVVDQYLATGEIITPSAMIKLERFFVKRHETGDVTMGKLSLADALGEIDKARLSKLIETYENKGFLCVVKESRNWWGKKAAKRNVHLYCQKNAKIHEMIHGYLCAAAIQGSMRGTGKEGPEKWLGEERKQEFLRKVEAAGWRTDFIYVPCEKYQYDFNFQSQ